MVEKSRKTQGTLKIGKIQLLENYKLWGFFNHVQLLNSKSFSLHNWYKYQSRLKMTKVPLGARQSGIAIFATLWVQRIRKATVNGGLAVALVSVAPFRMVPYPKYVKKGIKSKIGILLISFHLFNLMQCNFAQTQFESISFEK